ncbi:MAG: helix-turn-helix transcriptional regulator [Clostridia bacterium]|nr:helix-turn-helix transcriptional regulator [Clostridia bacterium]
MPYYEDFGADFHFFYGSTAFSGNIPGMHIHPHYEIMIVVNEVGQTPYINGVECPSTALPSVTVVSPFTMHKTTFCRDRKNERFVFYFGNDMIAEFPSFFQKFEELFENAMIRYTLSPELLEKILPMLTRAYEKEKDTVFMKFNFLVLFYIILTEGNRDFAIKTSKSLNKTNEIIEYMVNHYQENLTADEVAEHFFISRSKLNQDFKRHIQIGFHQLLMEIRLNQAFYMLENDSISIKEIASNLGFEKENYFNTFFKRMTGVTPLQYKKKKLAERAAKNKKTLPQ